MPYEKINDNEAVSDDGCRILLQPSSLTFAQGTRYLTIPVEQRGTGEVYMRLALTGSWMENGKPSEAEATLNVRWLKTRLQAAVAALGRTPTFDS